MSVVKPCFVMVEKLPTQKLEQTTPPPKKRQVEQRRKEGQQRNPPKLRHDLPPD